MLVSKHKLLLADDSITIQKVVNLTFADEGIEVISVGDGNSAMEKFDELTPDLVMADINMPGLSGYEICERIKGNDATRRIPVILLVGSFEPFDEQEAQRVGADDYLTKPFQSIRQLVSKVSDLLNASSNGERTSSVPNSFDDTLRMEEEAPASEQEFTSSPDQLNDVGTDDEMIQAYQVGSSGYDETARFQPEQESGENYGKTQPLSSQDFDEIAADDAPGEIDLSDRTPYDFTGYEEIPEQESSAEIFNQEASDRVEYQEARDLTAENDSSSRTEETQSAPIPELDEMDLLELPPREDFSEEVSSQPDFQNDSTAPAETTGSEEEMPLTGEIETNAEFEEIPADEERGEIPQVEVFDASEQSANLSPADIDAIAAKAAEKISDRVIREIVRELVPQMTDLIVKRLAEEKLKE